MPAVHADIIVVGGGAAGLMAASELSKKGKSIIILEARNRIGGRIFSLPEKEFGYPAEAGAEFVHGNAPVTKRLANELGIKLIAVNGQFCRFLDGKLSTGYPGSPDNDLLNQRLNSLKKDTTLTKFLNRHFSAAKYSDMRSSIIGTVQGYDAADPDRVSMFALRDEWLGSNDWEQYRIYGGYGSLLSALLARCRNQGVRIKLNKVVKAIDSTTEAVKLHCEDGKSYLASKVLVTVPLPLIKKIKFRPSASRKLNAASEMGYGMTIKIILRFKSRWWEHSTGKDLSKMLFMMSDTRIGFWWTQCPLKFPVLTAWISASEAPKMTKIPKNHAIDIAIESLSQIFNAEKSFIKRQLATSFVADWPADPFAMGAYSYPTVATDKAIAELTKPINGKVFFPGEALYKGKERATVEGALASGADAAKAILSK